MLSKSKYYKPTSTDEWRDMSAASDGICRQHPTWEKRKDNFAAGHCLMLIFANGHCSNWSLPLDIIQIWIFATPFVLKYKHLSTSAIHVWSFVLFEKFVKILFILLWYVLSSYIFEVYLNCFIFFLNFLNKTNGHTTKINKYLYFGTEVAVD